jgi:uncharacterized protein with von Willebrand factor type A (vWA) domain
VNAVPAVPSDLVDAVVAIVRRLRHRGVRTSTDSSVEAVRALTAIDVLDRDEVRETLRITLLSRPEDFAIFDEVFATSWETTGGLPAPMPDLGRLVEPEPRPQPSRRLAPVTLQNWMKPDDVDTAGRSVSILAPSDEERLAVRDFATYTSGDLETFRRLARRIARRLALRRSRRWKASRRGRSVDVRGTIRQAERTAGEMLRVQRRSRRIRRTRLLALCDVSGSMELYSRFLLQFVHALQNSFASVETFVFATRLSRVTDHLRGDYALALRQLGRDVRDWSGGTRIGEAIEGIVIILSDGWDVGDPATLERAMGDLRRRAGKVIWLNPLMGADDYSPDTRGMRAALPHVDLLFPAHNMDALERLVPRLVL